MNIKLYVMWLARVRLALRALRGENLVAWRAPSTPESHITIRKVSRIEQIPRPVVDPMPVEKLSVFVEIDVAHGLCIRWIEESDDALDVSRPWGTLRAGEKFKLDHESWGKIDGR